MRKHFILSISLLLVLFAFSQKNSTIRKKDRKKNVELITSYGNIVLQLYDSTPLHRDNILKLVKTGYYDGVLFHRVIQNFMIQSGDPNSKTAKAGEPLGMGGPDYTVPAEFRTSLFHKKGALAAARMGDKENPQKASSGSQFYIVQGKVFTDAGLDSVETFRLHRKIPPQHRDIYKTLGGTPHLDQGYTVFGEVVRGMDVLDKIAATVTSKGQDLDRPVEDIRITKARLIKKKRK